MHALVVLLLGWRPVHVVHSPGRTATQWRHRGASAAHMSAVHSQLTIVRHGQSEWNLANRFTGWVDVDLTERGITEARNAGRLLLGAGLQHDLVCTSGLRRAVRTACLCLSESDQCWVPMVKDVRLNEQHSGMLTGHNKRELADKHGVDQVMKWRRTYDCPPPPLLQDDSFQRAICTDERYRGLDVPATESLMLTEARVQEVWNDTIRPALVEGKRVLVVSHGNTLRALVKLVDGVSGADRRVTLLLLAEHSAAPARLLCSALDSSFSLVGLCLDAMVPPPHEGLACAASPMY